ncbi:polysaccharide ABC transporter ATP-binding protein [Flavobacterium sp.]|uniref:ABC transporter ATP-binding protein n=1 Tax=Flavobacterium sp. TaxID=239 RepID=UPI003752FC47
MTETVIKVENLSKAYQIGQIGSSTLSRDIDRFWQTKILGKEDPFLKIGETNDRSIKGESNIVWSLKDINFEVNQGDAIGIIGKNGAGKSTLLKLLSRVTSPTSGQIKVKGRIASLLEVGTGFHPELSGRENIFLNGAILGMQRKEITRKLDEIIDFSGVERYIDTPVKRYSSGMYVRLAFAVAAHLESEILIVDEVLAVGDADFQKKCIGKMSDISKGQGRTVLFVSHNMSAVNKLCNKGVVMSNGMIGTVLPVEEAVEDYLSIDFNSQTVITKFKNLELKTVKILSQNKEIGIVQAFQPVIFQVGFNYKEFIPTQIQVEFFIKDVYGVVITSMSTWLNSVVLVPKEGDIFVNCYLINGLSLVQGTYSVDVQISDTINQVFSDVFSFEIVNVPYTGYVRHVRKERFGNIYTPNTWEVL